jgi:hypothetical protein
LGIKRIARDIPGSEERHEWAATRQEARHPSLYISTWWVMSSLVPEAKVEQTCVGLGGRTFGVAPGGCRCLD